MKQIIILITVLTFYLPGYSQQSMQLSLQDVVQMAQTHSLQSFLVKNTYLAGYWQHQSFKANYLPELTLGSQLVNYTNANQLRYNSEFNTESYVRTQLLNSNASLSLKQNVGITGGTFYLQSDLDRNQNFGDNDYTQFSSRPFRIGYQQNLFGFNAFKWERKLEPKRYEQVVRQYLQDVEATNQMACNYFFNLAMAGMNRDMARYNLLQSDTLVQVARQRFLLGTIQREDLYELELNLNNAAITQDEADMQYRKNKEALLAFLRLPADVEPVVVLPEAVRLKVPELKALDLARERNAVMLEQQVRLLDADRQVARTRAENSFQANLNVSYGINKTDGYYDYGKDVAVNGTIGNVYRPTFDDYQRLGIDISIPILDWGRRKGQYQLARSRQEIARLGAEQAIATFEQQVITKVLEFNLQFSKVQSAAKSDSLAAMSYELTTTRFLRGNADVVKLTLAQKSKDNARYQYILSLHQYWMSYYAVRSLTLYDFEQDRPLEVDFEQLLDRLP
ncbi:MAG: TolC family protein [Breznakibacter sp.]